MIILFTEPSILGVLHALLRVYGAHRDLEVPGGLDGARASEGGFALN